MKKRLLKALKFVCLSALCGIGMAFFVDMVSEIAYNSASVSFSIMCMITVIVFSLLVFFVFFNNRKYETGEKFISLFITYCVMAIFMLSLFPLVYRINGGPLEAAVYNAHFKSAKMMFLTLFL
jgi:membrane-associated HD superfamily phosphohydrolase